MQAFYLDSRKTHSNEPRLGAVEKIFVHGQLAGSVLETAVNMDREVQLIKNVFRVDSIMLPSGFVVIRDDVLRAMHKSWLIPVRPARIVNAFRFPFEPGVDNYSKSPAYDRQSRDIKVIHEGFAQAYAVPPPDMQLWSIEPPQLHDETTVADQISLGKIHGREEEGEISTGSGSYVSPSMLTKYGCVGSYGLFFTKDCFARLKDFIEPLYWWWTEVEIPDP